MIKFFKGRQAMDFRSLVIAGCMFALFAIALAVPMEVEAEKQVFQFRPAANTTYIQTLVTTRIKDMGQYGKVTEVVESKTKVVITPTEDGYSILATPISILIHQNGEEIENPLTPLLLDLPLTYEVDQEGQLYDIRGLETLYEKMKGLFPDDVIEMLEPVMNKDALFNKEVADWMGRIGLFVGQEYEPGDIWTFRDIYNISPDTDITYYTAIKFGEEKKINNLDCVQIQFQYNTDPEKLGQFIEAVYTNVADAFGEEALDLQITDVTMAGQGERWMNPATMLVYREVDERTITMRLQVEGLGEVVSSMQEKKEYSFEYIQ